MTRRPVRVGAAVVVQLLLVGVAVWAPLSARLTGEEVRLRVRPVDPVDPFRGAYVDLGYPDLPSQPGGEAIDTVEEKAAHEEAGHQGTAYVPLVRSGDVWTGGPIRRTAPDDGPYLLCDDSQWRLRCGIESLFLPQGQAAAMQEAVRSGDAVATVKVDAHGHAALVGVETG